MAEPERRQSRQERRAADRGIAQRSPEEDVLVSVRVGACYRSEAPAIRQQLHDDLIASHPVRSGPVEWAEFETNSGQEVARVLRLARHETSELRQWITLHPGCILIVAMVPVPVQRSGGRA